jgi:hypothetical protein
MRVIHTVPLAALLWCLVIVAPGMAGIITGTHGVSGLGTFDGDLTYKATDDHDAMLQVTLQNTSAAGNLGYLTAFAFNNPGGRITGASLTSTTPAFHLIGDPAHPGGVNGAPFGQFDLGASTGKLFEGGGNPNTGIAVGHTELFWFTLSGNGLADITEGDFLSTFSSPPGAGQGTVAFVARFRGFSHGDGDKVPVDVVHIKHAPEPVTWVSGVVGVALAIGIATLRRRASGRR